VGPPPSPTIGSTWDWYLWQLAGFPVATLESCTVRGMGDHCYVVVQDSQWNVNVNQAQVDTIVDRFENTSIGPFPSQGIWDLNTSHFGMPPDNLDQDPRVYFVYYDFDVSSDGFFWGFDQQCDDVAQFHSNECDVVYMNCSDFDPAGEYLLAVLAHEFEHLIHYNQDPNEASWLDEGMAELAMWLYGNPDNISSFNSQPDRNLTNFQGAWADYIKSYLWSLYFYERYGGQAAVLALLAEPANSIAGVDAVLDAFLYTENFDDVFADWAVANFLDDTTIGDGRFGYLGDTLPPFQPFATFSSYPVGPNSAAVQHWGTDYVRYTAGSDVAVSFNGADGAQFAVRALLLDDVNPTQVFEVPLDALQSGWLDVPAFGTTHDELVMVHAGISNGGGTGYQYAALTGAVDAPVTVAAGTLGLEVRGGASARPSIVCAIPAGAAGQPLRVELLDVSGRRVRQLQQGAASPGALAIEWDGASDAGERVASGVYFARLTVGGEHRVKPVTLVR
ncbi:hypothetical protein K8I85_14500, partial [bacterium]|nr:hypothetical protein [bacterium]